ncbi:MAG: leucyl/phenylalanyl-tRNA--protein transferase [Flavobacteriales bacterium]
MPVFSLNKDITFPHPELAREDGLLAVGGDLSTERLLLAYKNGIFPWFNEEDPPLWWSPSERAVMFLNEIKISKSLKQELKKSDYAVRYNTNFNEVITNCQKIRVNEEGTWITSDIIKAYTTLHKLGLAHSVETYYKNELVGGLYGVVMGRVFCGESMFSLRSNASKIALVHLKKSLEKHQFRLIDCQLMNPHLESLGAREIPRVDFLEILGNSLEEKRLPNNWIND